jgi:hypothetical protein
MLGMFIASFLETNFAGSLARVRRSGVIVSKGRSS